MAANLRLAVERIHAAPVKAAVITAGGGASFVALLTSVPGCSNTLLQAEQPYAMEATRRILNLVPAKTVSQIVSSQLAQAAFHQACDLVNRPRSSMERKEGTDAASDHIVGIGATAALQTSRERRSADEVFVSVWSSDRVVEYAMPLASFPSRSEQEAAVCALLVEALAESSSVVCSNSILRSKQQESGVTLYEKQIHSLSKHPLAMLLDNETKRVIFNVNGDVRTSIAPYGDEPVLNSKENNMARLLYPGSFRPLHWGHTELARAAEEASRQRLATTANSTSEAHIAVETTFEISCAVADKKAITTTDELEGRITQFLQRKLRVAITSAMLFVEKAALFPGHGFIVGIDTARRILDAKYYHNSREEMCDALRTINGLGCHFLVGGRVQGNTWEEFDVEKEADPEFAHMFTSIPEALFRVDVSSTELRARKSQQ